MLSRAPAAHSETTGSHALENIDSEDSGRVAREQADFGLFQHPAYGTRTTMGRKRSAMGLA